MSAAEFVALRAREGRNPSKYRNVQTVVDGITFDSKAEARRYGELRMLEQAGAILHLELQPRFPLMVNGVKVSTYVADFAYSTLMQELVVEDVKSAPTRANRAYRLKRKLMKACLGIDVQEID